MAQQLTMMNMARLSTVALILSLVSSEKSEIPTDNCAENYYFVPTRQSVSLTHEVRYHYLKNKIKI